MHGFDAANEAGQVAIDGPGPRLRLHDNESQCWDKSTRAGGGGGLLTLTVSGSSNSTRAISRCSGSPGCLLTERTQSKKSHSRIDHTEGKVHAPNVVPSGEISDRRAPVSKPALQHDERSGK